IALDRAYDPQPDVRRWPAARDLHRDPSRARGDLLRPAGILPGVRDLLRGGRRARSGPAAHELSGRRGLSLAWDNALTDNCTTSIRTHTKAIGGVAAFDWRVVVNGRADQMLYERGALDTRMPFAQLRAACFIDPKAQAADHDPAFSERIREGAPRPAGRT